MPLVLLQRACLMSRIEWNLFGKVRIQNVGDIDFEVIISAAENSNKFQKTRFWKEKSVEDVVTLGPMAEATLVLAKQALLLLLHGLKSGCNLYSLLLTPQ